MAHTFNMPPNWPEKPRGWKPEPGWEPDPEWGPAPEGWEFWTKEETPEASGSTAAAEAPKKRPGLLLGASAGILALLAGGVFLANNKDDQTAPVSAAASQSATSAAASSTSATPSEKASSASASASATKDSKESTKAQDKKEEIKLVPGTPKELDGEYNGYDGKGLEVFDMIIPGGAGAYYTYTFKGEKEDSKFSIQGMNEINEPNIYSRSYQGKELQGAGVFDVVPGGTKTFKIKADGEGEWNIKLFPLSSAPVYEKGETACGSSTAAFFYEGDSSDVDVRFVAKDGSAKSSFALQSGVDDDPLVKPSIDTKDSLVKTTKVKGGKTLFVVSATDGQWSVSFK